jgi:beta-phosphoglucomutase
MYSAFLFDMDGTMIDNMMAHHRAWQLTLRNYGLDLELDYIHRELHGKNEEILRRLFAESRSEAEIQQIAWEKEYTYRKTFIHELKPIEGLLPFLARCQAAGLKLGIGTAAPPANVNFVLDNVYGLAGYFSSVVNAAMVQRGKPDPQVYELLAQQLDVPLEECLIFEDSPTGVEAARRAGCKAVVVTSTHGPEEFLGFEHVVQMVRGYGEVDWEGMMG